MTAALNSACVSKSFGPVQVLHSVSFALAPGRVTGLLWKTAPANHVGRSRGYEQSSGGDLLVDGQPVRFASSREAEAQALS